MPQRIDQDCSVASQREAPTSPRSRRASARNVASHEHDSRQTHRPRGLTIAALLLRGHAINEPESAPQ